MDQAVPTSLQEKIGIVFLHHRADAVTRRNLESFRECNPGVPIATVTSDERIEGGYSILDDPELGPLWRARMKMKWGRLKNRSGDLLLYYWYTNRREQADRWLIVEWDAFCAMPARDFIEPVAAFPLVAPSIRLPGREPEWDWFWAVETFPKHLRSFAMGLVPMCFVIIKDEVLSKIVEHVPWGQLGESNAELRFGTMANALGYPPVAHPLGGANISWQNLAHIDPIPRGMWHPIKYLVRPTVKS